MRSLKKLNAAAGTNFTSWQQVEEVVILWRKKFDLDISQNFVDPALKANVDKYFGDKR